MNLTPEEQAWLAGEAGPALRRAMEIIVALGKIYGAEMLIPVESVQISGVSYRNLGPPGLAFLRRWADEGARVRAFTTLNPTAMDMAAWRDQGFAEAFARKQQDVVAAFADMNVGDGHPTPTCTPYLAGNVPETGMHIAWAESSAVSYANSVLGARTNREGGPGAIAAALVGRTADYGLHLDANRYATLKVRVSATLHTLSDYSALGAYVGKVSGQHVPYFVGLPLTWDDPLARDKLKALGAAMAATGAVALYHVEDVTPEACAHPMLAPEHETLEVETLAPGYTLFDTDPAPIDLVWIGCPQASLREIARVADAVAGKRFKIPLWVTCARPVKGAAISQGLTDIIEAAGGRVFADACMAIAPVRDLGFTSVATVSAKGAFYLRNLAQVSAHFGPLTRCIQAAVTGRWPMEGKEEEDV